MRKSHRRAQNTLQWNINNLATTSKIVEHNLDTIITMVAGLPAMWYYKDNGLSLLTLIHIYIYFNICLSLPQFWTLSRIGKPADTNMIGCGKDEREGKNNALAGSIAIKAVGFPAMLYYKDNGLSLLTLVHIYIYFNILLSYLNSGH